MNTFDITKLLKGEARALILENVNITDTHIYDDELQDFVEIDYSVDDEKQINFDNGRYTTDIFPEKKYTGNYVFISPYEVACLDNYDTKKVSFFIKILDETNPNVLDIGIIKDSVKQQYKIAIDYR